MRLLLHRRTIITSAIRNIALVFNFTAIILIYFFNEFVWKVVSAVLIYFNVNGFKNSWFLPRLDFVWHYK